MKNIKIFNCIPAILCLLISMPTLADYQQYSTSPPSGLAANKVPMFVSIGFDDNSSNDGMNSILELLRNKKNPDGSPARVTFFNTTKYLADVKTSWKQAYKEGHEIGNHTVTHNGDINGGDLTWSEWDSEVGNAHNALLEDIINEVVSEIGNTNPNPEIIGFRAPRLEINNHLFTVLNDRGYVYDTSIEGTSADGRDFPWPYTLDHGTPGTDLWAHPGLWELGVMPVVRPNGQQVTGLDYNMWSTEQPHKLNEEESLETLKNTLDLRLEGNRSPFLFGAHSAFYSSDYREPMSINHEARIRVIKKFIEYALDQPEVYIVPYNDVVKWMRNPVALSDSISGGSNSSGSLDLDDMASRVNTFQELAGDHYWSKFEQNPWAHKLLSDELINVANDLWDGKKEEAMSKLFTARSYVGMMDSNETTTKKTSTDTINKFISELGYTP